MKISRRVGNEGVYVLDENCLRKIRFLSLFLLVISTISINIGFCSADTEKSEAILAISLSEDSLGFSYTAILEADRAGGQVSELVEEFNIAVAFLSKAERSFKIGEYDQTIQDAKEASDIARAVAEEAIILSAQAENQGTISYQNKVVFSFVLVSLIIIFGFLGWKFFKDFYIQRMTALKPEVYVDES